jgi:hypothetical protein
LTTPAGRAAVPDRPRRTLAVATSAAFPDLLSDWPLLRSELRRHNVVATTRVWTDADVPWAEYDLVLANGAWDNIHHPSEFMRWAEDVASVTRLVNTPAVLRWSMDKRYLTALSEAGVPIVPTAWFDPHSDGAIDLPAGDFVVKPSIAGGGFEAARYGAGAIDTARGHIDRLLALGRTVMVQPYQAAVDIRGETGLIFLDGTFSHAITKAALLRPGVGTRVTLWEHEQISQTFPTAAELATAEAALAVAHDLLGPTTYARADLVARDDGVPVVLELELLDPALFLDMHPAAATRFAEVLSELMRPAGPSRLPSA